MFEGSFHLGFEVGKYQIKCIQLREEYLCNGHIVRDEVADGVMLKVAKIKFNRLGKYMAMVMF